MAPISQSNLTEGAALYSTLASVLAGFAFTAIVLLVVACLSYSTRARRVLAAVGAPLVASFFGLLIMSVAYAAESTNTLNDVLTVSENTILGSGFAGVGVLLLYTVVVMLDAADRAAEGRTIPSTVQPAGARGSAAAAAGKPRAPRLWEVARFTRVSACLLNLLIMGLNYNTINLYESYKYGPSYSITAIDVLGWILIGTELTAALWASWLIIARTAKNAVPSRRAASGHILSYAGLAYPVASGVGYLIVDAVLPDTAIIPAFVVTAVAGGLLKRRPSETHREPICSC